MSFPDSTAERVSLWRALHVQIDLPPHVFEDTIGLKLLAPDENWRNRPDMDPIRTKGFRASIVARARYVEELVSEQLALGVSQYVILGAGLDTFAQRKPSVASKLKIFEVDKPMNQEWKRRRLQECGFPIPENLKFVSVDFESGDSWLKKLTSSGFDPKKPSIIASTGVIMYLTKEAIFATLRQIAKIAKGSTLAMTFVVPLDLIEPGERKILEAVYERAKAAGTPFVSFFRPEEIVNLAKEAGFSEAKSILMTDLTPTYFKDRADGLKPSSGEAFLIATT